jgi:hypothetical protein
LGYLILADLVVLIHLLFIGYVVFGGLLALRWRWMPWLHVPAALWGALVEFTGFICPLTPLENTLRQAAGSSAYAGDFVARYIVPIIYPAALTRELQIGLGLLVCLINALAYLTVWRRTRPDRPRGRHRSHS